MSPAHTSSKDSPNITTAIRRSLLPLASMHAFGLPTLFYLQHKFRKALYLTVSAFQFFPELASIWMPENTSIFHLIITNFPLPVIGPFGVTRYAKTHTSCLPICIHTLIVIQIKKQTHRNLF